jgi:hypothetical protein
MPTPPQLMPTRIEDGQVPGLADRIEGELVPVLHVRSSNRLAGPGPVGIQSAFVHRSTES